MRNMIMIVILVLCAITAWGTASVFDGVRISPPDGTDMHANPAPVVFTATNAWAITVSSNGQWHYDAILPRVLWSTDATALQNWSPNPAQDFSDAELPPGIHDAVAVKLSSQGSSDTWQAMIGDGTTFTPMTIYWRAFHANYFIEASIIGWRWSDVFSLVVDRTLPAPALVSPANKALQVPMGATLVWNAVDSAETYTVQIATDAAFRGIVAQSTGSLTHWQGTLLPSTTYYWRASAQNRQAGGTWSPVWSLTTASPPPVYDVTITTDMPMAWVAPCHPGVFWLAVTNRGNVADRATVKANPTLATGWMVHYFDGQGQEITTDIIRRKAGWQTPLLAAGASVPIRVEITPDSYIAVDAVQAVTTTATSISDSTKTDALETDATVVR
jgi:hypothetical protein